MEWCKTLQTKLAQCVDGNHEEVFRETAEIFMNDYQIQIAKEETYDFYDFADIEFYYYNKTNHKDPYVHCHDKQKECNTFYFHASGFDITFGDYEYYGGILIRGIKSKDEYISGPIKLIEHIFEGNYNKENRENFTTRIALVTTNVISSKDILRTTRIGLQAHPLDRDSHYIFKLYRFVDSNNAHKYRDKTKVDYYACLDDKSKINPYKKDCHNDS